MTKIAAAEAKNRFAELIDRANAGEEIEVTKYGHVVARIVAPKHGLLGPNHVEQPLAIGILAAINHANSRAELDQGIGHRKPGHAEPEHRDAKPRPIVVPAA